MGGFWDPWARRCQCVAQHIFQIHLHMACVGATEDYTPLQHRASQLSTPAVSSPVQPEQGVGVGQAQARELGRERPKVAPAGIIDLRRSVHSTTRQAWCGTEPASLLLNNAACKAAPCRHRITKWAGCSRHSVQNIEEMQPARKACLAQQHAVLHRRVHAVAGGGGHPMGSVAHQHHCTAGSGTRLCSCS